MKKFSLDRYCTVKNNSLMRVGIASALLGVGLATESILLALLCNFLAHVPHGPSVCIPSITPEVFCYVLLISGILTFAGICILDQCRKARLNGLDLSEHLVLAIVPDPCLYLPSVFRKMNFEAIQLSCMALVPGGFPRPRIPPPKRLSHTQLSKR